MTVCNVMSQFPDEYKVMISEENTISCDRPLKTVNDLDNLIIHPEVVCEIIENPDKPRLEVRIVHLYLIQFCKMWI